MIPYATEDARRTAHQALRQRLIDGEWQTDASTRTGEFFSTETQQFLPPPEMSRNPALCIWQQIAIGYDDEPVVTAEGVSPEDLADALPDSIWALAQDRHLTTVGLNESVMRLDHRDGETTLRIVSPAMIVASDSGKRSNVLAYVEEKVCRRRQVSAGKYEQEETLEVWDCRDVAAPVFKILAHRDGEMTDVTQEYSPAEGTDLYPYRDSAGLPIFPYVLWHKRVGNKLWDPYRGQELVDGTLTVACLWTLWIMGVRDGAAPQRGIIDLEARNAQITTSTSAPGVSYIRMNPQTVIQLASVKDRSGQVFTWAPTMEPEAAARSIETFEAGLAMYAGLDPADIQRGSASQSGYAIVVKRDGQRKAQKRLEPAMRDGDRLMLVTIARMQNPTAAVQLPEDPKKWGLAYAKLAASADEKLADVTVVEKKLGTTPPMVDPIDAYIELNPGTTPEAAAAKLVAGLKARRMLTAAMATPTPTPTPTEPGDPAALGVAA